jgi:DNA helicase-2/ATP-dependent DNA helicase PcrA
MFVGTIHGWCFHMLQDCVPRFGNHEVIDEHRHAAFLSREARALKLKDLGDGKHWAGIFEWIRLVDVIGNELMTPGMLEGAGLKERYLEYVDLMERFHFLTFSSIISQAVAELETSEVHERVCGPLRHLVVDEYQDINPAQERLIQLLSQPPVQLCVVGDDDQAIYQWRGSDVRNIVSFAKRRKKAEVVKLLENHRSRPLIVETAAKFARSISDRLPRKMRASRAASGPMLCTWGA